MVIKGIVLKESLKADSRELLEGFIVDKYPYKIDGITQVEVYILEIPHSLIASTCLRLSHSLLDKGYYAHFIDRKSLWIVFPNCVYTIAKENKQLFSICRKVGNIFEIPDHQMKFEELFINDHPNAQ